MTDGCSDDLAESSDASGEADDRPSPWATAMRWALVGSVAAVTVVALWELPEEKLLLREFSLWSQRHLLLGGGSYVGIYAIATVCLFPASLLTLAAGFVFHWLALPLTVLGASIGMAGAFLLARYVARDAVVRWSQSSPRLQAVDKLVTAEGWRIVFLLRLAPIVPYNLLNYALGLTDVGFWPAAAASTVGIVPGTALLVSFGAAAGSLDEILSGGSGPGRTTQIAMVIASLVALVTLLLLVTLRARAAIQRAIHD